MQVNGDKRMVVHFDSALPKLLSIVINIRAITFGRHVFVRPLDLYGWSDLPRLLRHEACHIYQGQARGWIRFGAAYVWDWAKNLWKLGDRREAYRQIPFEVEAREVEQTELSVEDILDGRHLHG